MGAINICNLPVGGPSCKVRAIGRLKNADGWSEVQTFTVKDITAPVNVSIKARVEGNSLLISRKTPKNKVVITDHLLQYGEALENSAHLMADELNYRIDGLSGSRYQYRFAAFEAAGNRSIPKTGKATIKTDLFVAGPKWGTGGCNGSLRPRTGACRRRAAR